MIHMKSLIRRLDCVPWLLAACFALVWAGEAQALSVGQGGRLAVNPDTDTTTDGVQYDEIALSLDVTEVSEGELGALGLHKDAASVPIKVTATRLNADGSARNDDQSKGMAMTRISLGSISSAGTLTAGSNPTTLTRPEALSGAAPVNTETPVKPRYVIDMPLLVIPKDKASASATVYFVPTDDGQAGADAESGARGTGGDDLRIWITGNDNDNDDATTVRPEYFMLRDNDRVSRAVTLSLDNVSLSKENDKVDITVTAALDAKLPGKALTFSFKDVIDPTGALGIGSGETATVDDEGFNALGTMDKLARRDAFYSGSGFGNIVIAADKKRATKKFSIDPINVNDALLAMSPAMTWIALGSEDSPLMGEQTAGADTPADASDDTYAMINIVPAFIKLTAQGLPKVDKLAEVSSALYEDGGDDQAAHIDITLKAAAPAGGTTVSVRVAGINGKGRRDIDYVADVAESRVVIAEGQKMGRAVVIVTPVDNDGTNDWQFNVYATVGDVTEAAPLAVKINDDEAALGEIRLRATIGESTDSPPTISEIDGETVVTITAYVIGKPSAAAVHIPLTAIAGSAVRDVDYEGVFPTLTIAAGETTGEQNIIITPVADEKDDGDGKAADETIIVGTTVAKTDTPGIVKIGDKDISVQWATINLKDEKMPAADPAEEGEAAPIALAAEETAISATVGEELEEELPAADTADEDAEVTYLLSGDLPAGLSFDADMRTISGTPTAAGEAEVTLYATDGTNAASLTYTITIAAAPTPEVNLEGITSSHTSVRENDDQATTITLTVTLAKAAGAGGESISLGITTPTEGKAAKRDTDFDATLDGSITIAEGARSGMAQLTLTPKDNTTADGHKAFGVQATSSSGHSAQIDIGISDNESDSAGIVLSVDPDEVSEGTTTSVTVTASLDGKAAGDDVTVNIGISSESSASRDVDYSADFDPRAQITIPAGDVSGTTSVSINAVADDDAEEGEETIILTGSADDLAMGSAAITLADGEMMGDGDMGDGDMGDGDMDDGDMDDGDMDDGMMAGLHFAEEVADQAYTAGTAIIDLVLPEAMGGEGDVTYQTFGLPEGLSFDAETRTVSGTPAAAAEADVLYLATDSTGEDEALEFSITVNAALSFGDLFGAGKIVPDSHGLTEIREFVIGQPVEGLTLPEGAGGTAPLTYSLSPALPAGLTFDAATRTIAGTPMAASETVYTYTVTDANGASLSMSLQTLPAAFSLADNFPNPFNPATTIQYALPQAADVELTVYNVVGQVVRTLVAEHQSAGRYVVEWDATNDNGHSLSSGMYFYRLQAGGEFLKVKKMLLLK